MKIYVAGKWQDKEKIREWYSILKKNGHVITCDWTEHDYPKEGREHLLAKYATDDINGVKDCDLFIGIFQKDYQYRGALVEMGAALALGKPVWILGNSQRSCIFLEHPLVTIFNTDYGLLSRVEGL